MRNLLIVIVVSLIGACATAPTTPGEEFSQLASRVEKEIREAEKTGFLWRDTEKLLHDAHQAQRDGQHSRAMELANQALAQAQLAQQQAHDNANAGPSYPKQ